MDNELDMFIDQDVMRVARLNVNKIESVMFGKDSGCGYQNDIFVSFGCNEDHDGGACMCLDVLDQSGLEYEDIDLVLAEKIAYYVAGLLGGLPVTN